MCLLYLINYFFATHRALKVGEGGGGDVLSHVVYLDQSHGSKKIWAGLFKARLS